MICTLEHWSLTLKAFFDNDPEDTSPPNTREVTVKFDHTLAETCTHREPQEKVPHRISPQQTEHVTQWIRIHTLNLMANGIPNNLIPIQLTFAIQKTINVTV